MMKASGQSIGAEEKALLSVVYQVNPLAPIDTLMVRRKRLRYQSGVGAGQHITISCVI